MSDDQRIGERDRKVIETYTRDVAALLPGPARERRAIVAELADHLTEAAEAGELDEALRRLGDPEAAAKSFARVRLADPAPATRRLVAAAVDNLPLIVLTVTLVLRDLAGRDQVAWAFPPAWYVRIGETFCVSSPFGCGGYDHAGALFTVGIPLALAWSVLGLGLIESRTGTTPGKYLLGLRVVTGTGLRISGISGIVRRLGFLLGPAAWLDWVPFLVGDRRRVLDRLAGTRVVLAAPREIAEPARAEPVT